MSKGVTPVVATILLIAVTVSAAGTMYTITQENIENQKEQIEDTDFNLNSETIKIDRCYRDSNGYINIVMRNSAQDAINASEVSPLINGSIKQNYEINEEIVNPQRTFEINLSEKFGSETLVILTDGETQIEHQCYDL